MKLIKCSDYVIEVASVKMESGETVGGQIIKEYYSLVDYANFLKRPLELGMFIPTDKEGNVLSEPDWSFGINPTLFIDQKKWFEAKDRVLFKGVNLESGTMLTCHSYRIGLKPNLFMKISRLKNKTIEDLCELGLELTESAIKQLKV